MKTFLQFLSEKGIEINEKGKRTGMGNYPPGYATVFSHPPLANAAHSAGHLNSYANIHGDVHKDLLSEPIKDEWEKNKKKKDKPKKDDSNLPPR